MVDAPRKAPASSLAIAARAARLITSSCGRATWPRWEFQIGRREKLGHWELRPIAQEDLGFKNYSNAVFGCRELSLELNCPEDSNSKMEMN
jgi:hypothetical protein